MQLKCFFVKRCSWPSTAILVSMPGNSGKRRKTHHVETVLVDSSDSELEVTFLPATPLRRRSQQAGLACGISSREYRNMKRFRIPGLFLQILACLVAMTGWAEMIYDGGEWMCGLGQIEAALTADDLLAFGYDIERDGTCMNFLDCAGFVFATQKSRQLKTRHVCHWDTVCSSWIWMSRRTSMRTYIDPLGNTRNEKTCDGNIMVARMIVLSLYHLAKFGVWLLEQPGSSLMRFHPGFEYLEKASAYMRRLRGDTGDIDDLPSWMAAFGGKTAKRSLLSSTHKEVLFPLHRTLSVAQRKELKATSVVHERIVVEDGVMKHKVTGKKDLLKETQQYPYQYGVEVSKAYKRWLSEQKPLLFEESSDSDYDDASPDWPEADLEPVVRVLCKQVGFVPCMI